MNFEKNSIISAEFSFSVFIKIVRILLLHPMLACDAIGLWYRVQRNRESTWGLSFLEVNIELRGVV